MKKLWGKINDFPGYLKTFMLLYDHFKISHKRLTIEILKE